MLRAMVLFIVCSLACAARADIYAFEDANGTSHFTNVPTDSRYTVIVSEPSRSIPDYIGSHSARANDHGQYDALLQDAAHTLSLDQALLRAVIAVESGYNPNAVSRKGAVGLMQLMPQTAQRYGVTNLYNPAENIHAGARHLSHLMRKFNGDLSLSLAAYNAGEDAVMRYGNRIPPYRETLLYVPKVMELYQQYRPLIR